MAQAPSAEQKEKKDDDDNCNGQLQDVLRLSHNSWIRCQYKKKSAIELQTISNIFMFLANLINNQMIKIKLKAVSNFIALYKQKENNKTQSEK